MNSEVVAFDVDGTLTVRDCVGPFLFKVAGRPRTAWSLAGRPLSTTRSVFERDRDSLKSALIRGTLAGRRVEELDDLGAHFAHFVSERWIRQDVGRRLRWHQQAGHVVVLVSASLGPYLRPLGDLLEVDGVVCTELESIEGELTGEIAGANCRGQEKVRRLNEWMTEAGLETASFAYAYGDSDGDEPMLSAARVGVRVDRAELEDGPGK